MIPTTMGYETARQAGSNHRGYLVPLKRKVEIRPPPLTNHVSSNSRAGSSKFEGLISGSTTLSAKLTLTAAIHVADEPSVKSSNELRNQESTGR